MMKLLTSIEGEPEAVARVEDTTHRRCPRTCLRGRSWPAADPGLVPRRRLGDRRSRHDRRRGPQAREPRRRARRVGRLPARTGVRRTRAGLDDCWAVLEWVAANGGELGGDTTRIAVGGDSAGGNLAAVMAIKARDAGVALRHQLLVYPAVDLTLSFPSIDENGEGYLLTKDSMVWFTNHYLGGADPKDPRHLAVLRRRSQRRRAGTHPHRRVRPAARRGRGLRRASEGGGRDRRGEALRRHDPRLLRTRRPRARGRRRGRRSRRQPRHRPHLTRPRASASNLGSPWPLWGHGAPTFDSWGVRSRGRSTRGRSRGGRWTGAW